MTPDRPTPDRPTPDRPTPDQLTPDRPRGAELLETAARELREAVLPEVPADRRLTLLMILSAMGMAARELRELTGEEAGDGAGEASSAEAARALARRIRAGDFDAGPDAEALHATLAADARRRLAIANPKYLAETEDRRPSPQGRPLALDSN